MGKMNIIIMGKITLKDVEVSIDIQLGRDPRRNFDFEGESLADLKQTLNQFGDDIATEFGVDKHKVNFKGAGLEQNRFVVF